MLFSSDLYDRIRSGAVTVAFRRWKRPTVSAGGTLRSPAGVLRIDEVASIDASEISDDDARAAGFGSPAAAVASLRSGDDRTLYRIRFHRESDDPRVELRQRTALSARELDEITDQLARWDAASRSGPWTHQVLGEIAAHPGDRSADLAVRLGVDQPVLKRRVRQLKELGLTESLETGYRLSPRGRGVRASLR
ncbi:MAG: MarR family transcriptional regulator [Actinomycetota bacterium]